MGKEIKPSPDVRIQCTNVEVRNDGRHKQQQGRCRINTYMLPAKGMIIIIFVK